MTRAFANAKPFLFEKSFDSPNRSREAARKKEEEEAAALAAQQAAEEDLPPPPPTFSEEELHAARQAAYSEGLEAGRADARAVAETELSRVMDSLTAALAVIQDRQTLANEVAAAEMARIVAGTMRKILPTYTARHGADEIVSIVQECLPYVQENGKLTIRVPQSQKEVLEERIDEIVTASGFEGRLFVIGDPALQSSDVKVDWGTGGAEREEAAIWKQIDTVIERTLNHARIEEAELSDRSDGSRGAGLTDDSPAPLPGNGTGADEADFDAAAGSTDADHAYPRDDAERVAETSYSPMEAPEWNAGEQQNAVEETDPADTEEDETEAVLQSMPGEPLSNEGRPVPPQNEGGQ